MKESEEHMMSIFHDRLDSLNGDFQSLQLRVQKLEQAAEESRALQAQIEMLEAKLAVQANASTVNDMRLHGVPYVEVDDDDLNILEGELNWELTSKRHNRSPIFHLFFFAT
ncbi:hypothetical protein ACLKA6_008550 [Drosophila palustris]